MYCYILAAPRLACVRPVASVHPEPGSNSSLYILFFIFFNLYERSLSYSLARFKLTWLVLTFFIYLSDISRSVLIVSLLFFQWSLVMRSGRFPFADAKVLLFSLPPNYFQSFFQEIFKEFIINLIFNTLQNKLFYSQIELFVDLYPKQEFRLPFRLLFYF